MSPREAPTDVFPQDKISVSELIKASLQDGKIDGEDLARLQEIQKRFEQDKLGIAKEVKDQLVQAKLEMLTNGFTVKTATDYEAFKIVAKMAGLGEKFPSYDVVTEGQQKSISLILEGETFWVYNYGSRAYATFGKDQEALTSNWAYFNEGKTSNNNTLVIPETVMAKIQEGDTQKQLKIVGLKNIIGETIQKAKDATTDTERMAKIAEANGYITQLSDLGVDTQALRDELGKVGPIEEEVPPPAVGELKNNGTVKLSDKTKNILQGFVANPEAPTMAEVTAILKKYAVNTNLYNGKDANIKPEDHIRITYAVQLVLNHLNSGDLQVDGARGPKSSQAIKDFQKSVGFKDSNPDDPAKVTDGIPGAATLAELLKKLETSAPAVAVS